MTARAGARPRRRHTPTRAELLARMQAAQVSHSRRPLDDEQLRKLSMCHHINLDAICTGLAEPSMLWDFVGGVLTWWKVSSLLQVGLPEMDLQLQLAARLCERWQRTGRVLFDGADMQLARDGVAQMDQLAEVVDKATAWQAVEWSQRECERMERMAVQMRRQPGATAGAAA